MLNDFLTTQKTAPPPISAMGYVTMIGILLFLIYISVRYAQTPLYQKTFKYLQAFQLVILYSWYFGFHISFANNLPFYHCRLAMFAMLLLPDKCRSKQYFALLGVRCLLCLGLSGFRPL